jgi:hypothetical protein
LLEERNSGRNALRLPLIRHWLLSHLPTFLSPNQGKRTADVGEEEDLTHSIISTDAI